MVRLIGGVFLLIHAIITGAIWIPPQRGETLKGFGWQANWLFAESRPAMVTVGVAAASALAVAGVGVLIDQDWWVLFAAVGAVGSLALITVTFTPWWSVAIMINLALLYLAFESITAHRIGEIR